jgi:AbrB family looped-hinge helix DNA binding protein
VIIRPIAGPDVGSATLIDRAIVVRSSGGTMSVVTVSPKYQVVIPRHIREALGIAPGQKVQAFEYEGRVEFIPVRPAKTLRGFVRGLNTTVTRERDRK